MEHGSEQVKQKIANFCELHQIKITDRLPRRCPLATRDPLATLAALQEAGWRELLAGDRANDVGAALATLAAVNTCRACPLLATPAVRRIRARRAAT